MRKLLICAGVLLCAGIIALAQMGSNTGSFGSVGGGAGGGGGAIAGSGAVGLVPVGLGSTNANNGRIIASTTAAAGHDFTNAFAGSGTTYYTPSAAGVSNWIEFYFTNAVNVTSYQLSLTNVANWILQASGDGATFANLDYQTNTATLGGTFAVANTALYNYYRLQISQTGIGVSNIQFFGVTNLGVTGAFVTNTVNNNIAASANGVTPTGAGFSYGATNTFWLDSTQGSDTNSGRDSFHPIATITNLQTKSYFSSYLKFGPGTYTVISNQPLVLSNNVLLGNNTIITGVSNEAGGALSHTIEIDGAAYLGGGLTVVSCNTNAVNYPILMGKIQPPDAGGQPPFVPVTIQGIRTVGFSDGFGWPNSTTWSNTVHLVWSGNTSVSGWDCFSMGTLTGTALATNFSTVSIIGNVFDTSYYNFDPTIPGYAAFTGNGGRSLQINPSCPFKVSVVGNEFFYHDNVAAITSTIINAANPAMVYLSGNTFATNNVYGSNLTQAAMLFISTKAANTVVEGHPWSENNYRIQTTGHIYFTGDINAGTANPAAGGMYNFLYSDGTNRLYLSTTNAAANGSALRYTNGFLYWAP